MKKKKDQKFYSEYKIVIKGISKGEEGKETHRDNFFRKTLEVLVKSWDSQYKTASITLEKIK